MLYQARIFLVIWTLRELTPCKMSHICRCDFNGFCFTCLRCNQLSSWTCGYLYQRSFSLKQNETVFLNWQNLIFFVIAESTWFVFYFKLNIFTGKISNLLLPLGTRGLETVNFNITKLNVKLSVSMFSYRSSVKLILKINFGMIFRKQWPRVEMFSKILENSQENNCARFF